MAPPRIPPTRFGRSSAQAAGRSRQPGAAFPPLAPQQVRSSLGRLTEAPPATPRIVYPAQKPPAPLRGAAQRKPAAVVHRRLLPAVLQRMETTVTSPPAKTKPIVKCTMGQGITGLLDQVILHSDGFSTCTPIVMFNENTGKGGLFHFAAESLSQQAQALRRFCTAMAPTVIYIGDRSIGSSIGGAFDAAQSTTNSDLDDLTEYFKVNCFYKGKIGVLDLRAAHYYITLGDRRELAITAEPPKVSGDLVDYSDTRTPKNAVTGVALFGQNRYKNT